jgi:hypothetical protein
MVEPRNIQLNIRDGTMKLTDFLFLMIFIVSNLALSQSKLSINKPEIDLGTIYNGMKKQGTIVLMNIGNDTLRIYSVQPTCGCTAIKQPKNILLPYESDAVLIEFNSAGYHGKVEKYVNITTNDPTSQYVTVKLIANVKEELEPKNHSVLLWFGTVNVDKTSEQSTYLKNVSEHPIKIKGFAVSSPSISVKLEKRTLNPNDSLDIQVTIKAEKVGYSNEHFTVETDSKNQPSVEMRVSYIGKQD